MKIEFDITDTKNRAEWAEMATVVQTNILARRDRRMKRLIEKCKPKERTGWKKAVFGNPSPYIPPDEVRMIEYIGCESLAIANAITEAVENYDVTAIYLSEEEFADFHFWKMQTPIKP